MSTPRHQFASAFSTQTLAQGLQEYFAAHPSLKRQDALVTDDARQFLRSHDIVHVVYGCGTSMPDEAVVKLASLLGTTGGWRVLQRYRHFESLDIYTRLPLGGTLLAVASAPYLIARTLWRCAHQKRRWPWIDNACYLDTPLCELRDNFGIMATHARRAVLPVH